MLVQSGNGTQYGKLKGDVKLYILFMRRCSLPAGAVVHA
jgi:hypothetical protein